MPDSTGNFKGIAISHVPWHLTKENHNLSSHWFCEGEACERDCHCPKKAERVESALVRYHRDEIALEEAGGEIIEAVCDTSKCSKPCKPCKRCDKGGTKEGNDW